MRWALVLALTAVSAVGYEARGLISDAGDDTTSTSDDDKAHNHHDDPKEGPTFVQGYVRPFHPLCFPYEITSRFS